jgi:phage-related minor tail protein
MGAGVDPTKAGGLVDQQDGLQKILDKQQEIDAAYRSIGDTIRGSMGSAISELIRGTQTWEQALINVVDNLANVLLQIGINGIFDGIGGGGGFLGKLFSPQGRAIGGPVSSGTPYIVGERGPELFIPGTSGSVMTNRDTMSLGGGGNAVVNVTVHNNGSSTVTGDDASRLGNMVQAAVAATIQREQRPGGSLNRRR